jgi:amidase
VISELHYARLVDVARLIESRQISPLQLTQSLLARIEDADVKLKSYATLMPEQALAAAKRAETEIVSGFYRGPLHGVPIAIKDLFHTKGTRTMGGLAVRKEFIPDLDATVVSRLEQAGAVILGKLNMTEGARASYHPSFDIPVNPWNASYWSGVSSSGSGVAVAAGLCFAALGTDTGGSIRYPSMANGIVGLKPTYGLVSRCGVMPLAESLDHVGPMARTTIDAAIMLETIAGHDKKDPSALRVPVPDIVANLDSGIQGLKIGVDRDFSSAGSDARLLVALETALEVLDSLGASIVDIQMPQSTSAVASLWTTICSREAHDAHAATFPSRALDYGDYFREFLEIGAGISDSQYAIASQERESFVRQFVAALDSVDAIICPAGGVTFPIKKGVQYRNTAELQQALDSVQRQFTIPANFAGTPALTVPCGFSDKGIPYALQVMGPHLSEARLCRVGHAYEAATEWYDRHPEV